MQLAGKKRKRLVGKKRKRTPPELAREWGVSPDKVTEWIRTGELPAIDASSKRGQRPRYLIDIADIEAFEQSRAVQPTSPPRRRRSQSPDADVIRFF